MLKLEAHWRSFRLPQLEPSMSGFAGRMRFVGEEVLEWFPEWGD
jgi:hypothetical protein